MGAEDVPASADRAANAATPNMGACCSPVSMAWGTAEIAFVSPSLFCSLKRFTLGSGRGAAGLAAGAVAVLDSGGAAGSPGAEVPFFVPSSSRTSDS